MDTMELFLKEIVRRRGPRWVYLAINSYEDMVATLKSLRDNAESLGFKGIKEACDTALKQAEARS